MLKLPSKPFPTIQQFLQENDILVYRYMVLSISRAIRDNKDKAELFSFGRQDENIAVVRQMDYETVINDAISKFAKVEEYEYAAFARDLLKKWKIEQVINENNTQE
jgi:protein-arginine kinase activator protein McsA